MNLPSRTEKAFLFSICVVVGLMASKSQAQTHSGDIELQLSNSQLTTSGGTYAGPLNGRVFEGIFPSNGLTSNPGFDSAAGFLQPGETIRFDFVREVLYWNGTALTQSERSMTVGLGSSLATLTPTDFSGKAGFEIAGGDGIGAFHQHLNFSIGNAAPAGLYGVVMTLGPAGTSTFGTSDPFLIAFRRNASALNPQAGLDAMAATLVAVPEPSTLGLVVAGVVAGVARRCRRRTRTAQKGNQVASATPVQ